VLALEDQNVHIKHDCKVENTKLEKSKQENALLTRDIHTIQKQLDQYKDQLHQHRSELEALVARRELEQINFTEENKKITKSHEELGHQRSILQTTISRDIEALEKVKESLLKATKVPQIQFIDKVP
jgi:hypothetical protein